ncbi:hypothetical protein, partial [Hyphomicrobium album]|uniref:hypothetical protein n=1 Tax=Hyphomicrobium album TaxID=2665159 RepID=UPI001AEF0280
MIDAAAAPIQLQCAERCPQTLLIGAMLRHIEKNRSNTTKLVCLRRGTRGTVDGISRVGIFVSTDLQDLFVARPLPL